MGRRFPEFCIIQAACRVSVKASSSTTGDARVASYQAAINSVAARYYADWPFMVEVLNKWLEINQDFVRDPLGYAASNYLPAPVLTSDCALTQILSAVVEAPSSPFPKEPGHTADSSPPASTSGMEPSDLDHSLSSPNDRRDIRVPIYKLLPLTWTISFHFLRSLWNLMVSTLPTVVTSSLSRFKQNKG